MGIYIFEPSGAGGTPTLQQVLTAGNYLTSSAFNSINVNNGTFQILNGTIIIGGSTDIVKCGDINKDGYLTIDNAATGGSHNLIGCYQQNPNTALYFRNYFLINPDSNLFYIGDYAETNFKGWIAANGANNYFNANRFEISEVTAGSGVISLKGTGYTYGGNPTANAGHLIIEINGTTFYIPLKT